MLLLGWLASLCITVPLAVLLDRYVSRRYEMESWIPDRFRKRFFNETTYELTPLRQEYEYLFTTRAPVRVRSRRDPLCAVGRTFRYYIPDDLYEILSKLRSVLVLLDRDMRRTLDPTKACAKIVTTDYFKKISAIEQVSVCRSLPSPIHPSTHPSIHPRTNDQYTSCLTVLRACLP